MTDWSGAYFDRPWPPGGVPSGGLEDSIAETDGYLPVESTYRSLGVI